MKEERNGLRTAYHLGTMGKKREDGKIEYVRPPRYLWLVKYNEEYNKVITQECGQWFGDENVSGKNLFFYDGCICACCIAENEVTAQDKTMPFIMGSLVNKYSFLSKYIPIRCNEAEGIKSIQMVYDKEGKPVVGWPLECKIADDPTRDDTSRK